jgi:hypothetical protein
MMNESDLFWDKVIKPLQNPRRLSPSTPAEAIADFEAAQEMPLSADIVDRITASVMAAARSQDDQTAAGSADSRENGPNHQPVLQLAPETSYDSARSAQQQAAQARKLPRFSKTIVRAISIPAKAVREGFRTSRMVRYAAAAAVLIAVLFGARAVFQHGQGAGSPFALLARAYAAEADLFIGQQIVHLRNQIVVTPVADAMWARSRWLPLASLEATGKVRIHQLALPAEVNKGYTVEDECWYDPPTGRFVRLLTCEGRPIFANSYDGSSVYTLQTQDGGPRIVSRPVTEDFRRPENPAQILGIGAGLQNNIDAKNEAVVHDAGKTVLEDGTEGQIVKLGLSPVAGGPPEAACWLVTIRSDNNIVEKMEFMAGQQPLLAISRVKTEGGQLPSANWNLSGLAAQAASAPPATGPAVRADMVVPGITVQQMVKRAGFETYMFATDPPWAGHAPVIDDVLDPTSPPQRMFGITCRAEDGRHIVLVQAPIYNKTLGLVARTGSLVYTSPSGVKVWGGPQGPWLAQILLQSARHNIKDKPGKDLTGYILETPAGTFPALAINGKITDEELHALIDSLVPARDLAANPQVSAAAASGPAIRADLVVPGISVEQMAAKASFVTYAFARNPAWAARGPIVDDALDIISPPQRMYAISYPAKDKRHVVLVESASFNAQIGPKAQTGELVYSSPTGVKVWSHPERGPWLAQILLQSVQYNIKDAPGKELSGYILETPDGTFPVLAINGKITDEELHDLVDSLVPARDLSGNQ